MANNEEYAKYVYEMIKADCGELDAIYGDYISTLIGIHGLEILLEYGLLETCGVVYGRQLYSLVDWELRKEK